MKKMKIAYIVLSHKNIPQIHALLQAIQGEHVFIYLHLDRLAGQELFDEAGTTLRDIHNLTFLQRFASNWGGFGLVEATLAGIRAVLAEEGITYAMLLSGQDYPIKPAAAFERLLAEHNGKSLMEYYRFPLPHWKDRGGCDRIERWYFSFPVRENWLSRKVRRGMNRLMNTLRPARRFPAGFVPFGGSQWWCLHRDSLLYIVDFVASRPDFVRFFRMVRIPDEIFFHTILLNSPLADMVLNRALMYVDWDGPPYPRILKETDLAPLRISPHYFARKFDLLDTPKIFEQINGEILQEGKQLI
jgi:hypothetical protein